MHALGEEQEARLEANLEGVRARVAAAARRAGRAAEDVRIVAVTKTVGAEVAAALWALGVHALGENRPEEALRKQDALGDRRPSWHMIGHYQRKKIPRTLGLFDLVHSVHDLALMSSLDHRRRQEPEAPPLPILIQVNVAGESRKQGFSADEALHAVDLAEALPHVEPRGLMTMAPLEASEGRLHEVFGGLKDLAERGGRQRLPELSMGMSDDFEIAIEEGATLVRIGSALFDGLPDSR